MRTSGVADFVIGVYARRRSSTLTARSMSPASARSIVCVTRAPSSSATRPNGSAPWNTSRATPSVVPNKLASSTSRPRDGQRARERLQQPRPVVGDDRDHDVTAVDPFAPHRRASRGAAPRAYTSCRRRTRARTARASGRGTCRRVRHPVVRAAPRGDRRRRLSPHRARSPSPPSRRGRARARPWTGSTRPGPVAFESPMVNRYSSRSRSASPRTDGGDVVGNRRVGEIASGRDVGHQQMVAHQPRQDLAGFAVESHTAHDVARPSVRRPRSGRRACPWRCRAGARRAAAAPGGGTRARPPLRRRPRAPVRAAPRPRRAGARTARPPRAGAGRRCSGGTRCVAVATARVPTPGAAARERLRDRALRTPEPRWSPERSSRTNPARCQTSHVGSPVWPSRANDARSNGTPFSAAAHAASIVRNGGIDPSASVSMCTRPSRSHTPSATAWSAGALFAARPVEQVADTRPHVAGDPRDLARRAREIVHERVGRRESELLGDRVLFLEREPIGVRAGYALERDADVEQELAPGLDAAEVGRRQEAAFDDRCAAARRAQRPTRPFERLQVAETARALFEVGFEHLGDHARSRPANVGGVGQLG